MQVSKKQKLYVGKQIINYEFFESIAPVSRGIWHVFVEYTKDLSLVEAITPVRELRCIHESMLGEPIEGIHSQDRWDIHAYYNMPSVVGLFTSENHKPIEAKGFTNVRFYKNGVAAFFVKKRYRILDYRNKGTVYGLRIKA
jgi:hypothetical protein